MFLKEYKEKQPINKNKKPVKVNAPIIPWSTPSDKLAGSTEKDCPSHHRDNTKDRIPPTNPHAQPYPEIFPKELISAILLSKEAVVF